MSAPPCAELRNPLAGVAGFLQTLRDPTIRTSAVVRRFLGNALVACSDVRDEAGLDGTFMRAPTAPTLRVQPRVLLFTDPVCDDR